MEIITHVCDICHKEIKEFDKDLAPFLKMKHNLYFREICDECDKRFYKLVSDELARIRFPDKEEGQHA